VTILPKYKLKYTSLIILYFEISLEVRKTMKKKQQQKPGNSWRAFCIPAAFLRLAAAIIGRCN